MCTRFLLSFVMTTVVVVGTSFADTKGQRFGYDGRDGYAGNSGNNGRDGMSATHFADGTYEYIDLSGTDGGDGMDGRRGEDARSCYQPHRPNYDLQGADGGNGGRGGSGGNGGNAGSFTVYFSAFADLKMLNVDAISGKGGRTGRGEWGGSGCRCSQGSWTIQDPNGTSRTYYCRSGQDGRNGYQGSPGREGTAGTIAIINQDTPLQPTKDFMYLNMEDMESGPFLLSANNWRYKSGARNLFAAGSQVPDAYYEFVERIEKSYAFSWDVDRPITDFAGERILIRLASGQIKTTFPENLWYTGETISGDVPTYSLTNALTPAEATNLEFTSINGYGNGLNAVITDNTGVSEIVETTFKISYYTKAAFYYYLRYEGEVSPEFISQNGNEFTIDVGALGINSKWLQAGRKAMIKVSATRALGSKTAVKVLEMKKEL